MEKIKEYTTNLETLRKNGKYDNTIIVKLTKLLNSVEINDTIIKWLNEESIKRNSFDFFEIMRFSDQ